MRAHDDASPSRHYLGSSVVEGAGERVRLPLPRLVLISEREDGFYLERLLEGGEVVGDTAHDDASEAREQAAWEYGALLGPWRDVPVDVLGEQVPEFALRHRD